MELKEYYKILKSNVPTIFYTTLFAVVVVYAWSVRASQTYLASLLLNVSRAESQVTSDYRYDQFYRLEADEKFSENIVEWLKTAGTAQEIFSRAEISPEEKTLRQLAKSFRSEKLSSNIIGVHFSAQTSDESEKIAKAMENVVSEKTKSLNSVPKDPVWFEVKMSDLAIRKNEQDLRINLGIAILAGIFFGSLLSLGKHYISEQ